LLTRLAIAVYYIMLLTPSSDLDLRFSDELQVQWSCFITACWDRWKSCRVRTETVILQKIMCSRNACLIVRPIMSLESATVKKCICEVRTKRARNTMDFVFFCPSFTSCTLSGG